MDIRYFFLTSKTNLSFFEGDRLVLNKKEYNSEVVEVILKLKENQNDLDVDFMSWMSENSIPFEMSRKISDDCQTHLLNTMSFEYLHSILRNLFSYYNFFPKYRKYSFLKHGYPINVELELQNFDNYIIYKEDEEAIDTIMVSDLNEIKQVLERVAPNTYVTTEDLKINEDSILLLQYYT